MDWQQVIDAGWKLVAAGGGGAVVGLGAFKVFGKSWLDQQFKERLEKLKHEQAKEIEAGRQEVQAIFSRISKIHEKEFEILPKAWFLLHTAHGLAAHLMVQIKSRPDFDKLSSVELDAFLKESRLSEIQKSELRRASNAGKYYDDARFRIDLNEAHSAHAAFHNYLIEHRIFMTDELRQRFSAVDSTIGEALIEHRLWKEGVGRENLTSSITKITQLSDKIAEVEKAVQERLHYASA